jgi:RNA polymerase sigma-70 factor (ECF subfamily)
MANASVTDAEPQAVTQLLKAWRGGDASALDRLIPIVYRELHRLARQCLRREHHARALHTSTLVHEAYLRLVGADQIDWNDRSHFFAVISQLMRQVLVDAARRRHSRKRSHIPVSLDEALAVSPGHDSGLIALDDALRELGRCSARKAQVVELRYFAGLTIQETAAAMGISTDTVKREWRTAKLWLLRELRPSE